MKTALLVSEQRLKQWTNLDENVRTEEITPFIISATDIYVQTSLGTQFVNRLKQGVIDNDLNSDEITLLNDYIAPMLMQYSLYLMLPSIKYKVVEKGLVSGTSEDSSDTNLDELKYMRETTLVLAEFYDQRLREYLCDVVEPNTFPQYSQPGPRNGMDPNKSTPYFGGLVTNINYNGKGISAWCSDCHENGCDCQ